MISGSYWFKNDRINEIYIFVFDYFFDVFVFFLIFVRIL